MIFWEQFNFLVLLNLNYLEQLRKLSIWKSFLTSLAFYSHLFCACGHLSLPLTLVGFLD